LPLEPATVLQLPDVTSTQTVVVFEMLPEVPVTVMS
jgi:hypothetical protein